MLPKANDAPAKLATAAFRRLLPNEMAKLRGHLIWTEVVRFGRFPHLSRFPYSAGDDMQATDKLQLIRWLRRAALSAVLAVTTLAALAGCKSVDLKGDGFHDDMARWGEKQRPPDQPQEGNSEMLGVSAKSQQVERNLGVR